MEEIISAIDSGNVAEAVDLTWDLVSVLVGDLKGEPIWHNGECATIAASILIVATEAPKEYRNLTNVYYFLANMAKPDPFGEMPIWSLWRIYIFQNTMRILLLVIIFRKDLKFYEIIWNQ